MIDVETVRAAAGATRDPEIRQSLADLGLLDDVIVEGTHVTVQFHLTSPLCPSKFAVHIGQEIKRRVRSVPGVETCNVVIRDHFMQKKLQQLINAGGDA